MRLNKPQKRSIGRAVCVGQPGTPVTVSNTRSPVAQPQRPETGDESCVVQLSRGTSASATRSAAALASPKDVKVLHGRVAPLPPPL